MGRFLGQSQFRYTSPAAQQVYDVSTSGPTTMVLNSLYFVNTTSNTVSLTLPYGPLGGEFVDVVDAVGKFDTNNCIILPSGDGSTVGGFSDNLTLNLARINLRLQYSVGLNNWVVTQLL